MTVTLGAFTFNRLTAQPFGYEETETRAGLSARTWNITGLATPTEWISLLEVYDTWRNLKIQQEAAVKTGVVGATVSLTANGVGGQSWTAVPCWFSEAPAAEQAGAYVSVSFSVVDAAQALQVALKQEEEATEEEGLDLGTFTIAGVQLKLLRPPDSYTFTPTLEQTADGSHYVTGPLSATLVKSIEGETNQSGWDAIRSWYETIVQTTPSRNSYFPLTPPSVSASSKVVSGVKTVVYVVTIELAVVK